MISLGSNSLLFSHPLTFFFAGYAKNKVSSHSYWGSFLRIVFVASKPEANLYLSRRYRASFFTACYKIMGSQCSTFPSSDTNPLYKEQPPYPTVSPLCSLEHKENQYKHDAYTAYCAMSNIIICR